MTARDEGRGMEAVKSLEEKGISAKFHQLDINCAASRRSLTDFIRSNYPNGLSILINNADIINDVALMLLLGSFFQ